MANTDESPDKLTLSDPSDLSLGKPIDMSETAFKLSDAKAFFWMRLILFAVVLVAAIILWCKNYTLLGSSDFYILFMHQPWSIALGLALCAAPLILIICLMFCVYRRQTGDIVSSAKDIVDTPLSMVKQIFNSEAPDKNNSTKSN